MKTFHCLLRVPGAKFPAGKAGGESSSGAVPLRKINLFNSITIWLINRELTKQKITFKKLWTLAHHSLPKTAERLHLEQRILLHITLISLSLFFLSLSDSLFRGGGPKINLTGKEKNQMQIGLALPDSQNALGMRLRDFSLKKNFFPPLSEGVKLPAVRKFLILSPVNSPGADCLSVLNRVSDH